MNETKSKTKISSGTIAIIALSIVLILSLITTITLAYFSATRNVVTTVQFANGVTLQMQGAKFKGDNGVDTPPSKSAAKLYWVAAEADGTTTLQDSKNEYGGYTNVNDQLEFEDLKVRAVDSPAYVAIHLVVSATNNTTSADVTLGDIDGYADPSFAADWTAYTTDKTTSGWVAYKGGASALDNAGVTGANYSQGAYTTAGYSLIFNTGYAVPSDHAKVNNFAGITITYGIYVVASDTADGLKEMVDGWTAP